MKNKRIERQNTDFLMFGISKWNIFGISSKKTKDFPNKWHFLLQHRTTFKSSLESEGIFSTKYILWPNLINFCYFSNISDDFFLLVFFAFMAAILAYFGQPESVLKEGGASLGGGALCWGQGGWLSPPRRGGRVWTTLCNQPKHFPQVCTRKII